MSGDGFTEIIGTHTDGWKIKGKTWMDKVVLGQQVYIYLYGEDIPIMITIVVL